MIHNTDHFTNALLRACKALNIPFKARSRTFIAMRIRDFAEHCQPIKDEGPTGGFLFIPIEDQPPPGAIPKPSINPHFFTGFKQVEDTGFILPGYLVPKDAGADDVLFVPLVYEY